MANNGKNGYSEEWLQGLTEDPCGCQADDGEQECGICGEPACNWHGREYRTGWEHETCHELPDFTRADDGAY